jgi:microcystin-dependent protein
MAQPFVGEIRMFASNFAPQGWAICDGQLLAIAQNQVLFQLIGTTYGGDGQTTFALPDLRGRVPVHQGGGFVLGQAGGEATTTLTPNHLPSHNHELAASSTGGSDDPAGHYWAASNAKPYASEPPDTTMHPQTLAAAGGNQAHDNMPPYLGINFIISLFGIFPSQN